MQYKLPLAPKNLADWLAYIEALHPLGIDMTLERTVAVAKALELRFQVPVVMVGGTNGKGSTCALLESILLRAGYRVGLYSKPHLNHFEERCRINGVMCTEFDLLPHFEAVELARKNVTLTYFEFTSLAIMRLLSHSAIDVAILEVGLGGRLDAVNVVDADCSIITSIDLVHIEYLGPDRESIGYEKAHIMRSNRPVIVSDPMPPQSVLTYAEKIKAQLHLAGRDFSHSGDRQQWQWKGRSKRYHALAYPALRGVNQILNASGVLAALEALALTLPISAQAIREGLALVNLPGRFQILPGQPVQVLDVAHNPHAAVNLAVNLDQMGFYPRNFAVFGAMADKNIEQLVQPLLPLIDSWFLTDLPTQRAATSAALKSTIDSCLNSSQAPVLKHRNSVGIYCFNNPSAALKAAVNQAQSEDRIIVFGSFYTVGGVLN